MWIHPRFLIGVAVTAGFVGLLLFQVEISEVLAAFTKGNYVYLLPGVAVYFLSLYARAYRWSFMLAPLRRISSVRLFPIVAVGYMANNLLPVRLGELVRSYYLSRKQPISASVGLATILVERVFDGLVLLFLLLLAAFFLPLAGLTDRVSETVRLPTPVVAIAVTFPFIIALILMLGIAFKPGVASRFTGLATSLLPSSIETRVNDLLDRFFEGFLILRNPGRFVGIVLLSIPVWCFEGAMYYLIALGFELNLHFETFWLLVAAMLLVTSVSNLATSIPSSQGAVGPFEFFAVLALVSLGVSSGLATAYAVVLHLALLFPVVLLGLIILGFDQISLGQLISRGERGDDLTSPLVEKCS